MPWFPWAPILGLAALGAMIVADLADPAIGRMSLVANLAVMSLFAGYYAAFIKGRGRWRLTGPDGALSE